MASSLSKVSLGSLKMGEGPEEEVELDSFGLLSLADILRALLREGCGSALALLPSLRCLPLFSSFSTAMTFYSLVERS